MAMASWRFVAILAAALSVSIVHGKVIELADADFDSELENHDTALVMFYAPWCGHCKRLKPEFEKAAGDLLKNDPPVQLAKVDCTEAGKDVCKRFEVQGYPTLKIFRSGELSSDYNGPREAGGIVKHMRSQVGPVSKELTDDAAHKKLLDAADAVVVVGSLEKSDQMEAFQKAASKMRETAQFAHSSKASDVRKAGIYLHRPKHLRSKLEDAVVKYEGDASDHAAISQWVTDNYHGLVGHRTPDNAGDFKAPYAVAYYAVDYELNPKGTNYWRNRIMKVAKGFAKTKLTFAVSNRDDFQREMTEFGLEEAKGGDKPVVTIKDEQGKKFVMEDEFSVESFKKFLEKYEAGEVEPHLKSEPVPESNDGPVKVAVAKNFDELVTRSEKDVLVEFYAPWCGHCKSLAPVYDELGEKMADEDVEIVKMDATANDVPTEFQVSGFPTLYWVKRGEKPVSYNGGRSIDDFIKYIAENASNELKAYTRKGKEKKTEL